MGGRGSGSKNFRFVHSSFRQISIFSCNFTKKIQSFKANFQKISIFQATSQENSISRQKFPKDPFFRLSRKKCPFKSACTLYFWPNYSTSLQKLLHVHCTFE